jgi:hypothetical protein
MKEEAVIVLTEERRKVWKGRKSLGKKGLSKKV